jgi:hypothetical protein
MRISRRLFGLVAAGALATMCSLAGGQPAHANGWFVIKNLGTGECLQPDPSDTTDVGVRLVQEPCHADTVVAQRWTILTAPDGQHTQFQNQSTQGCMDAHGPNADHTPVDTWPCSGISNQRWTFGPFSPSYVVSVIGNRCLDVLGGSSEDGTVIEIFHCLSPDLTQGWFIE